jgi:hypothetical protein
VINIFVRAGRVAQVVKALLSKRKALLSKREALSSRPVLPTKKKKNIVIILKEILANKIQSHIEKIT